MVGRQALEIEFLKGALKSTPRPRSESTSVVAGPVVSPSRKDVQVYFCDPQSPWQHGTNENTNGLLRQYFPKGTDLSIHRADEIAAVAAVLNARPRKTLKWKTPAEALDELLS